MWAKRAKNSRFRSPRPGLHGQGRPSCRPAKMEARRRWRHWMGHLFGIPRRQRPSGDRRLWADGWGRQLSDLLSWHTREWAPDGLRQTRIARLYPGLSAGPNAIGSAARSVLPLETESRSRHLGWSLNLSQFVEDQNGRAIGANLPGALCWQQRGLRLPARSARPARTHSGTESSVGTERTRGIPASSSY